MFPPTEEERKSMHLDRCMRILPHHQNTGGFFVAVFRKVDECPRLSETSIVPETTPEVTGDAADEGVEDERSNEIDNDPADSKDDDDHTKPDVTTEESGKEDETPAESKRAFSPPPNGKIKNAAYVEDPFVFLSWEKDRELLQNLKDFYGFEDDFPFEQVILDRDPVPILIWTLDRCVYNIPNSYFRSYNTFTIINQTQICLIGMD